MIAEKLFFCYQKFFVKMRKAPRGDVATTGALKLVVAS